MHAGIHAVAFDLDDTLTDWWAGIAVAARVVGDETILDRVRAGTWRRRDGVVVNRHHWRLGLQPEDFVRASDVDAFRAALDPPLFPDVQPALDALSRRFRLALLTNNPYGAAVLERHGLHTEVFECVVVADPDYRKPNPRAFMPLVDALGLPPEQIAYVGDAIDADVEGAHAFGLRAVWLDRWDDGWTPPSGVPRISSLLELETMFP
jgi:HAD superfamily hydrolase (TIGR01549 family)